MKATIITALSERAQRSEILAGRSGAKIQSFEIEVTPEEAAVCSVSDAGDLYFRNTLGNNYLRTIPELSQKFVGQQCYLGEYDDVSDTGLHTLLQSEIEARAAAAAQKESEEAAHLAAIKRYLSGDMTQSEPYPRLTFDSQITAEFERRKQIQTLEALVELAAMSDEQLLADATSESGQWDLNHRYRDLFGWPRHTHKLIPGATSLYERVSLLRDTAVATKEAQKQAKIDSERREIEQWINAHGSDLLRMNLSHGMLCRDSYRTERLALEAPGWTLEEALPNGEDRTCKCASVEVLAAYDTLQNPNLDELELIYRIDWVHDDDEHQYCEGECDNEDHLIAANGCPIARATLRSLGLTIYHSL